MVLHDLLELHPGLTRPGVAHVLQLMDLAPSENSSLSLSAALKAIAPNISDRLSDLGNGEASEYLRILRGTATQVLQMWTPDGAAPRFEAIATSVEAIDI